MEGQLSQRPVPARPTEQEGTTEPVEDKYKNLPRSRYRSFKLPPWYEDASFQYNRRIIMGLIPGVILLGITEGANLFAAVAISVLVVLLVHQGGGIWNAVVVALVAFFLVALVSIYSIAPLIWRSVLNYPLALISHLILMTTGAWCLLLLKAFRLYDPSMTVMLEKVVMGTFPMVVVLPMVWEHLMLFPASFLPHSLTFTWFYGLGLFVVPLQSSFAKRNTPKDEGLILDSWLALGHLVLFVTVPPVLECFLSQHLHWIDSTLSLVLFLFLPTFLLTLLDTQGMMYWTGVSGHLVPYIRRTFGAVVLACVSLLLYRNNQSEMLLLAFPMVIVQFLAVTSSESDEDYVILPRQIVGACSILFAYMWAFLRLPWGLSYRLSPGSPLSLDALQLMLLAMAFFSVVLFVLWKRISNASVWIAYVAAFSLCEHILMAFHMYHPLLVLLTSALGITLMHRLWMVRRISRNCVWVVVSILLTKLTKLLLTTNATLSESCLAHAAVFLIALAAVRMGMYQNTASLKPSHLVFFTVILAVGLLMSVSSLLAPLWLAATHTLIPISLIVAFSLFAISLYVMYSVKFLKKASPQWLSRLPLGIIVLAVILGLLQPEFGFEIVQALMILYVHYFMPGSSVFGLETPGAFVAAWTAVLEWCVLLSLISTAIAIFQRGYRWLSTLAASFWGAFVGVLLAAWLLHHPPTSAFAIEYAVVCSLAAITIVRAITATRDGTYVDTIMFALQLVVFTANFSSELYNIDSIQEYEPEMEFVIPPTSRVHFGVFLFIALSFKVKQYFLQNADQSPSQTYMALSGNLACCLVFLLAVINPIHTQQVVSILASSLVFLLLQEDGYLVRISLSNFPLAPCVMVAVLTMYGFDAYHLYNMMSNSVRFSLTTAAMFYGELALLLLGIPGHFLVIWYLWTGKGSVFHLRIWMILALFIPNSLLAYCSSSPLSLTLAGIAVTGLALTAAQQTN